jgi:hypothetical protein
LQGTIQFSTALLMQIAEFPMMISTAVSTLKIYGVEGVAVGKLARL